MPHRIRAERAACIDNPALFQHELLEDPSLARGDGERQRRLTLLTDQARATCAECPLFESCLYDAVVKHDVAGFVAGTTERQRSQILPALGVSVEPEDLDTLAGVMRGGRQINHQEVPAGCARRTRTRASRCWRCGSAARCRPQALRAEPVPPRRPRRRSPS